MMISFLFKFKTNKKGEQISPFSFLYKIFNLYFSKNSYHLHVMEANIKRENKNVLSTK